MESQETAPVPTNKIPLVLIADDSESTRYVLATWLRRAGFTVIEAMTGAQAITIASETNIDIAVLDVNLPDITGYEVCEYIKALPNRSVPVLHVSATAIQSADRSEGLRRGADGYLMEPIEREELLATVEALLRGAAAERLARRLARRLRQLNEATLAIYQAARLNQLMGTIAREASILFEDAVFLALTIDDAKFSATCHAGDVAEVYIGKRAMSLTDVLNIEQNGEYLRFTLEDMPGHYGLLLIAQSIAPDDLESYNEILLVLGQFGRAANTALRNMRLHAIERRIALTLQRSLLPEEIPTIEGVEFAVHYQASAEHAEVGGDFYEIFALDSDTIVLAVGDVVGHSLEAAAIMVQLRTSIRSYLLEGHAPAKTMDLLNHLLQRFHPGTTATACVALYDRRTGMCSLVNAGHPPPLVLSGSQATFLPTGGLLLGFPGDEAEAHSFFVAPGDTLVLYTDGLLERRGESLDDGFNRLAEVAAQAKGGLDTLCQTLLRDAGPQVVVDDIALVAFRRQP